MALRQGQNFAGALLAE